MLCENCGENEVHYLFTITRKETYPPENYKHFKCHTCGFEKAFGKVDEGTLKSFYSKNFFKSNQQKLNSPNSPVFKNAQRRISSLSSILSQGVRLLDLGAGNGAFVKLASNKCTALGIESSPHACLEAKKNGINLIHGSFLTHDFGTQKFNIITMWDVVSCFDSHNKLFQKLAAILEKDGYIIFTIPNNSSLVARILGKYWPLRVPPVSLTYHSKKSILKLLERYPSLKLVDSYNEKKYINLNFLWMKIVRQLGCFKLSKKRIPFGDKVNLPLNLGDILTVVIQKEES